ncbi:MAG: Rv0361 family membrane protein [Mycobacterium sp.]
MTEPDESRPTLMPIIAALAIVGVALAAVFVMRLFRGDEQPDTEQVARAAVGQNDALQREDYADFREFTCAPQQGAETQVLNDQRESKTSKGARYVDDVTAVAVNGERATATVVYHFEKKSDDKVRAPMTFIRENGGWKVCSPGPR